MYTKSIIRESFAAVLIALLVLIGLRGIAAAAAPAIAPLTAPVAVGSSLILGGRGFTSGSVINFFVSAPSGAINEGPLKPSATSADALTVNIPSYVPLGQGVVAMQVVNTDQGYVASSLVYALLQGSAAAGIPSIAAINGVSLAATSSDPRYALDNVETVVAQGGEVTLQGTGFDMVNGVAVDLFCACAGGKVGPFFINPGDPGLSANSITVALPAMGPYAQPAGPASFVVSNKGTDGRYTRKSNAVSVPLGRRISVISVRQDGATLTVDGTGLSTLTAINFFASKDGEVVNLGGMTAGGSPAIAITLVSDTEFSFTVPVGAAAGRAYVQALNPPFIPFSSSGNDANGAFILVDATSSPTATVVVTPSPVGTPVARGATPSARPTFAAPSSSASSTGRPTATASATPVAVAGVLLAGGTDNTVSLSGSHPTLASAEVYDEMSGTFVATTPMGSARLGHSVTMLNNGKILVAGGHNAFTQRPMPSAELYDIKTASFSFTGGMNSARLGHAAVLLNNGKVFVSGGSNVDFSVMDLAELYDPSTEQFTPTASLNDARVGHTATLLKDGTILVAGGANDSGILSSAELYNADASANLVVGSMSIPRQYATATLLKNGKVLIAGGAVNTATCAGCATDTAELYDPATKTFTSTASMHSNRRGHSATALPDGRVLIAGGLDDTTNTLLDTTEIYDPVTGTFTLGAQLHATRFDHTASMLASGKVLIAGGFDSLSNVTNSAELYDPSSGRFTATGSMANARTDYGAASFAASSARPSTRLGSK